MASQPANKGMTTRSENRAQSPFTAQMRRRSGMMQPVTIRDMSSNGLQGNCFNAPLEGETVTIRFANDRSVHGMVRWSRKGVFGVEFKVPVNVATITENAKTYPLRRSTDVD